MVTWSWLSHADRAPASVMRLPLSHSRPLLIAAALLDHLAGMAANNKKQGPPGADAVAAHRRSCRACDVEASVTRSGWSCRRDGASAVTDTEQRL